MQYKENPVKSTLALIMALALAVVAVVGVRRYIEQKQKEATAGMTMVEVVAAKRRVLAGTPITRAMLVTKQVAQRYLHDEAIVLSDVRKLVGQVIQRNVDRGTELLWSYFSAPEAENTRVLLMGERAVTLPVDMIRGVAGLVQPNSRVDIYGTFAFSDPKEKGAAERQTILLLSDVTVLAIDSLTRARQAQSLGRERRKQGYSSITVACSPQEASLLIFAQGQGDLFLALRHHADVGAVTEKVDVTLVNMRQVAEQANLRRAKKTAAKAAPPALDDVE